MKLGVVTTSYPRTPGDPAGNFVEAHVHALRSLGHAVEVIAAGAPDASATHRVPSELFYRGGAPDLLERRPLRSLAAALSFSARLTAAVATRAHRWDSIIAHWLAPSALAALPARVPLLAIAHGGDVHTLRRLRLLGPVLHLLRARDAQLVFVSEQLRTVAVAAAPRLARWLAEAIVQPMGIERDRFDALVHAPTDPPTLVVAARLVPIKGVDVLLEALAHVRAPTTLVIAGDGPDRAVLEARASALARQFPRARISFVGLVDTRRRDELLTRASVLVIPSRVTAAGRTEGTPLIALEALAAGVPVVASAVGGLTALAPAAHLVAPDDPQALAAAIETTLASPPSAASLRAAVAHLDWRTVAARMVRNT